MSSEAKQQIHLRRFILISRAEGVSFLLLVLIGMPLKYMAGMPLMVKYVGWAHGLLFMAYIAFVIVLRFDHTWFKKHFILISIASIVPFGTFIVEHKLRKLN